MGFHNIAAVSVSTGGRERDEEDFSKKPRAAQAEITSLSLTALTSKTDYSHHPNPPP